MCPKMGMGTSVSTAVSERTAVIIEDYMFDAAVAGELAPEESPKDFHDTWDLDGTDFTPEASPDDEGYWDDFENVVTNGTFDADSNWSKGTGWTISGGKASSDGTEGVSYLRQNGIVDLTSTYEIKFTVSNSSSGTLNLLKGNASTQVNVTSNGNYTFYTTWDGSSGDIVFQSLNFVGSVDNVSVTEYAITPLDV